MQSLKQNILISLYYKFAEPLPTYTITIKQTHMQGAPVTGRKIKLCIQKLIKDMVGLQYKKVFQNLVQKNITNLK